MNFLNIISQFVYAVVFFLGLALGSFLNSWIWRTHENIKIGQSRSMCPACRRQLAWYENIPVFSYLFLLGRCRTCKKPIPKHFIFVELAVPLVFMLVTWKSLAGSVVSPALFLRNLVFAVLLIIIFVYDWLYQEILPEIVWIGAIAGLAFNIYLGFSLVSMLIGLAVAGGFFLLQFVVSKGAWIGGGDVRLGAMMGIWLGWPVALLALFLAYISGANVGVLLIALKKKHLSSMIPFGTFLAAATFVALLWGNQIIDWYLGLLR